MDTQAANAEIEPTSQPLLEVSNLTVEFATRNGTVTAVRKVDLAVAKGETVGIVGESGSGKSVTSYAVMRILDRAGRIAQGTISFSGIPLHDAREDTMLDLRGREISMIFQNPRAALNPIRQVGRQIEDVLVRHAQATSQNAKVKAIELLKLVRINDPQGRYHAGSRARTAMITTAAAPIHSAVHTVGAAPTASACPSTASLGAYRGVRVSVSPAPTRSPSRETRTEYTVIEGPRWYQQRIRSRGPAVALVIPGALGVIAFLALQLSDASWSGILGLIGGYFAAPALLLVGAPFADRGVYPIAVLVSAAMWLIVGFVASRRATRNPMATWTDFWRHYLAMLVGIWCGIAIALIVATIQIGSGVVDWT